MTETETKQRIGRMYELMGERNYAALAAYLTEDFFVTEASSLPYAGIYSGPDALRDLADTITASVNITGAKYLDILVGGEFVAVIMEMTLEGDPGPPVRLSEVLRFRGDKCCEIRPHYFDPLPLIAAADRKRKQAN